MEQNNYAAEYEVEERIEANDTIADILATQQ